MHPETCGCAGDPLMVVDFRPCMQEAVQGWRQELGKLLGASISISKLCNWDVDSCADASVSLYADDTSATSVLFPHVTRTELPFARGAQQVLNCNNNLLDVAVATNMLTQNIEKQDGTFPGEGVLHRHA